MIGAYKAGKDLYATIASGVYNNDYWDNMEHHEDGSPNPDGKKRRSNCKSLLLGIMYGRGANSIAEQIHCTPEEAQKIVDDFYNGFPKVKEWVDTTESNAKINGYVEDFWGRRRRLPDIQLPRYTVKSNIEVSNFNPLLNTSGLNEDISSVKLDKYSKLLATVKNRFEYNKIKNDALNDNITIINNGSFISQAQRQCVNARVQGGAASMSKLAMRKVFDNEELKALGFKIVLQIHDELIGECPEENAEKVAEVLTNVMKHAAEPVVTVPFKCDADISPCWYYNDFGDILKQEYANLVNENKDNAYEVLKKNHLELTEKQIREFLNFS